MSEQKQTVYVPGSSAKARQTSFGECLRLSFKSEALLAFIKEHTNKSGYINLDIAPRREVSQYGDTHSIKLDTWEPSSSATKPAAQKPAAKKVAAAPEEPPEDEPPF